ncbi:uncharacterized protein LOC125138846 [Tachysurus fulvidraco]|uniref:uncharacterized protein LOC125138846 n=1 Tax=Tachysurus fulvidraco TaxID=1234273 RepID=UPI001FEF6FFF|nr:uncharacterized protein LOC125138846 [Tachysurus fulvidraco]
MERDNERYTQPRQRQDISQKVRAVKLSENSPPTKTLEPDTTSSTDHEYVTQEHTNIKQPMTKVCIAQQPLDILIDTGATVNLLDKNAHDKIKMSTKLQPTNKKILPYGKQQPLPLLGKLTTNISAHGKTTEATVYVVEGDHGSLLSLKTATELGLIHIVLSTDIIQPTTSVADQLLSKYPNITNGIGKLKNVQVKLYIDDTVKPIAQPHRRIPFHVRKKVEKELQLLEDEGIIEKVEGPTPWVSPIVAMPKPKNPEKIRICVDMRLPNQALLVFQNTIQQVLQGFPGVQNFSDDILVYGTTADAYNRSLEAVFQRLHENNLTINKSKFEFHKTSLEFFGYLFSNKSISPDHKKIEAITDMPSPLNQSEMRSLLGMANYSVRFIPNYSSTTQPLKKDSKWIWGKEQRDALKTLKHNLVNAPVMSYFHPDRETNAIVDASPVGLRGILEPQITPTLSLMLVEH